MGYELVDPATSSRPVPESTLRLTVSSVDVSDPRQTTSVRRPVVTAAAGQRRSQQHHGTADAKAGSQTHQRPAPVRGTLAAVLIRPTHLRQPPIAQLRAGNRAKLALGPPTSGLWPP